MEVSLKITSLAHLGKGIGRHEGKVVFVPFTAPGDEVVARILSEKKGFCEGSLVRMDSPSALRTAPLCRVYEKCGGCSCQHIAYDAEVQWKDKIFRDAIERIGKAKAVCFDAPMPSLRPYNYRGRARIQAQGKRWGFFEAKTRAVVDIDECPLLDDILNTAYSGIKQRLKHEKTAITSIELCLSQKHGSAVARLYVKEDLRLDWQGLLAGIAGLKGFEVFLMPDEKRRMRMIFRFGDTEAVYSHEGIEYLSGIGAFSQVNLPQNSALIRKALEYAGLSGNERVLDLFSGIGNLTLPFALKAGNATGVELNKDACLFARNNAEKNSIKGVDFIPAPVDEWLENGLKGLARNPPDVVILDPPRSVDAGVARLLADVRPKKIIYISCNPPELARDISSFADKGYMVGRAGFVDFFPRTFHIEGIALLEPI